MKNDLVTVICPINIALIKYWGKKDSQLNIPLNSSLSITLDSEHCYTKTTVRRLDPNQKTTFILNGKEIEIQQNSRIDRVLQFIYNRYEKTKFYIESINTFPTGAGMASSASGFCALAMCFGKLCNMNCKDVAILARLGSGSACRSLFGGFVEWTQGSTHDGSDSLPTQLYDNNYWDELAILSLVCSDKQKEYSSTNAMLKSVETSDFLKYRIAQQIDQRMYTLKLALKNKSFQQLALVIMQESNSFHAICQDTYPPIVPPYLNNFSYSIIRLISHWNSQSNTIKAAYTFDAGPNAFIILPKYNVNIFLSILNIYTTPNKLCIFNYNITSPLSTYTHSYTEFKDQYITDYIRTNLDQLKSIIYYNIGKGPYFC